MCNSGLTGAINMIPKVEIVFLMVKEITETYGIM
jgi:hypothetical protein